MSGKQTRLEALKLAVAAGGAIPLAVTFEHYIEEGAGLSGLEGETVTVLASGSEIDEDAPKDNRRRRKKE